MHFKARHASFDNDVEWHWFLHITLLQQLEYADVQINPVNPVFPVNILNVVRSLQNRFYMATKDLE